MLLCIIGILVLIFICDIIYYWRSKDSFLYNYFYSDITIVGIIYGIAAVLCVASGLVLLIFYSGLSVIDQKIEMYTEENTKIENQISDIVSSYMTYEQNTFEDLKVEDALAAVYLYPELKSDELIKSQITLYESNNNKIKELKEDKIDGSVIKWWLYFGK